MHRLYFCDYVRQSEFYTVTVRSCKSHWGRQDILWLHKTCWCGNGCRYGSATRQARLPPVSLPDILECSLERGAWLAVCRVTAPQCGAQVAQLAVKNEVLPGRLRTPGTKEFAVNLLYKPLTQRLTSVLSSPSLIIRRLFFKNGSCVSDVERLNSNFSYVEIVYITGLVVREYATVLPTNPPTNHPSVRLGYLRYGMRVSEGG